MTATPKVLCAIYTRKSTEEGLDQNFNSLDAQHDACANYIASQKSEGWMMLKDRYDDGGFSGGTLERPAIKRLLEDVRKGLVNTIVVYKIDRLSRSCKRMNCAPIFKEWIHISHSGSPNTYTSIAASQK